MGVEINALSSQKDTPPYILSDDYIDSLVSGPAFKTIVMHYSNKLNIDNSKYHMLNNITNGKQQTSRNMNWAIFEEYLSKCGFTIDTQLKLAI